MLFMVFNISGYRTPTNRKPNILKLTLKIDKKAFHAILTPLIEPPTNREPDLLELILKIDKKCFSWCFNISGHRTPTNREPDFLGLTLKIDEKRFSWYIIIWSLP
ncbi:hypothetical protein CEXT_753711 [Caerostris extrusa]|uniref:LAGLIDADG homing endonuclease n=1 Tax=Caerostris extrusa TaxID=172846 RepID=A0AAV4N221_CAEEX|nr:hypothetical protein CEXT_753711 [Caerostris extrusa]